MVSRADQTRFAEWWWTVDKYLLAGIIALMIGGVVLSLAAADVRFERSLTLANAVAKAADDAARDPAPESVVLLSPACASYDQFPNFEKRGDAFRAIVADVLKNGGLS